MRFVVGSRAEVRHTFTQSPENPSAGQQEALGAPAPCLTEEDSSLGRGSGFSRMAERRLPARDSFSWHSRCPPAPSEAGFYCLLTSNGPSSFLCTYYVPVTMWGCPYLSARIATPFNKPSLCKYLDKLPEVRGGTLRPGVSRNQGKRDNGHTEIWLNRRSQLPASGLGFRSWREKKGTKKRSRREARRRWRADEKPCVGSRTADDWPCIWSSPADI